MKKTITLPGLIDIHVHLRDPGQTHKEDFFSGTSAALAGGYTAIFDMPNNAEPIVTSDLLCKKIQSAQKQIVADIGFYFGSLGNNFDEFSEVIDKVRGLKIYLNVTTGNYKIDTRKLIEIYKNWPSDKPILLHAEDDVSELVMSVMSKVPKNTHICHVSSRRELEFVMNAKQRGFPITCGVTPHHLFLTNEDAEKLGPYGYMKPFLKSNKDVNFLWDNMDAIDVIESDHAPHTKIEKESINPPFGVPGLETTLPLMLTAQQEGRLTHSQLLDKLHNNAVKIIGYEPPDNTVVEVELEECIIKSSELKTKCGWTPFDGRRVAGKVVKTIIEGKTVFMDGEVIAAPGSGRIIL